MCHGQAQAANFKDPLKVDYLRSHSHVVLKACKIISAIMPSFCCFFLCLVGVFDFFVSSSSFSSVLTRWLVCFHYGVATGFLYSLVWNKPIPQWFIIEHCFYYYHSLSISIIQQPTSLSKWSSYIKGDYHPDWWCFRECRNKNVLVSGEKLRCSQKDQ